MRRDRTAQCLPELRRRLRAAPDPAEDGMAPRRVACEAAAIGEARAFEIRPRRIAGSHRPHPRYQAGGAIARLRLFDDDYSTTILGAARRAGVSPPTFSHTLAAISRKVWA